MMAVLTDVERSSKEQLYDFRRRLDSDLKHYFGLEIKVNGNRAFTYTPLQGNGQVNT